MSDYKPGTFAMVTLDSGERVWAMRLEDEDAWRTQDDIWLDRRDGTETVSDVRPLVVLDPDDAAFVVGRLRYFADLAGECGSLRGRARGLADQIEAQSRPPKPAEPTGLGAVVEDASGERWMRVAGHEAGCNDWRLHRADDVVGGRTYYIDIDAVRVLSDGWELKP